MKTPVATRPLRSSAHECYACKGTATFEMLVIVTGDHYYFCGAHLDEFMQMVGLDPKAARRPTTLN
jgi:hypothetical protein